MKTLHALNIMGWVANVFSAQQKQTNDQNLSTYEEFQKHFGKLNISESEYLNKIKKFKQLSKNWFAPKTKKLSRIILTLDDYGGGGSSYSNSSEDVEKL